MMLLHWNTFLGDLVKYLSLKIFRNHLDKALSKMSWSIGVSPILNRNLYWDISRNPPINFSIRIWFLLSRFAHLRYLEKVLGLFKFVKAGQQLLQTHKSFFFFCILHNRKSSCTCRAHLQTWVARRLCGNLRKKCNSFHETVYVSLFLPNCKMVNRKPHPVPRPEKLKVVLW